MTWDESRKSFRSWDDWEGVADWKMVGEIAIASQELASLGM